MTSLDKPHKARQGKRQTHHQYCLLKFRMMTISRTANVFNLIKPSAYETRARTHMSFRFLFFFYTLTLISTSPLLKGFTHTHSVHKKSSSITLCGCCIMPVYTETSPCFTKSGISTKTTTTSTESADPSLFSLSIELHKHKLTSKSLALSSYTHIQ